MFFSFVCCGCFILLRSKYHFCHNSVIETDRKTWKTSSKENSKVPKVKNVGGGFEIISDLRIAVYPIQMDPGYKKENSITHMALHL